MTNKISDFFGKPVAVVNVGLASMAQPMRDQSVPVVDVDWKPPMEGVQRLHMTRKGVDIDAANEEAIKRIKQARPVLVAWGWPKRSFPECTPDCFCTPARR